MQQLLHEAIENNQKTCCGILTGSGNIVTDNQSVTPTVFASPDFSPNTTSTSSSNSHLMGAYIATDKQGSINPDSIKIMHQLHLRQSTESPFYYLILHMDHKGRIDAHMYTDPTLQSPMTLLMCEQSNAHS